jgi:hypothetical protein
MSAAALIRQKRAMQRFVQANATTREQAQRLQDLGVRPGWPIRRMIARGVFVPVGDDRFYLDVDAWARFRHRQLVIIWTTVGLILIVWLLVALFHRV